MKRFYEVLDKKGRKVEREDYRRAMLKRYRQDVPIFNIKDNTITFIYPSLIGPAFAEKTPDTILRVEPSNKGLAKISLEGDENGFPEMEITATINCKFKLRETRK